jgi:hypothetical protein
MLAAHRQTWRRECRGGPWRIDIFREPWKGDDWTYDRDGSVCLRRDLVSYTVEGIPFAQPEVVLRLKARAPRAKDETDFATVRPHLNADQRRWLRDALALVHPGHAWIEVLREPLRRSRLEGQRSSMTHSSQRGLRAWQTRRPCQMSR